VWGDCIFSEGKSQEMGLVGVYFGMFQAFSGAIPVQPANEKRCRLIDRQGYFYNLTFDYEVWIKVCQLCWHMT
jgi:hypothetical protein